MKNLSPVQPFQASMTATSHGTLTTLTVDTSLSAKDSIASGETSLLTNYVYREDGSYQLVYTVVSRDGQADHFAEDDGILPALFLSPRRQAWVSIVPYHPDKELEISLPVFQREQVDLPKGTRPFVGDFIGSTETASIFHAADWSDTKPDKLLVMHFEDDLLQKKSNLKLSLPGNNKVAITGSTIQLLAHVDDDRLHREIDAQGNELRRRSIAANGIYGLQILTLSFDGDSCLLAQHAGQLVIVKIDMAGNSEIINLIAFEDEFFNTWRPEPIGGDTLVTRFNCEFGNGWLTTRKNQLIELYYSKDAGGYRNLLNGEVLELPHDKLVISSLNRTAPGAYAVVLYPMAGDDDDVRQLLILNRTAPVTI
ncbi:hypothetical protein ASR47_100725 [Janthinobacterium psychrotolerans]|uniref:Uncharacterized protein n=2 Tax=Janthinobacterium psychrotolerans TaxID=1747903 RepID=A0A1A7C132_9BURK|nr:hypothetical protein ASR47_100725 [Janthinobacterium psychrotolerans]